MTDLNAFPSHKRHRASAYNAARSHSRRVAAMKLALPLLAGVGLLWFGGSLILQRVGADLGVDVPSVALRNGAVVMQNPEVTGVTSDNRPYRLVAREALQDMGGSGKISLKEIDADFALSDGTDAALRAPEGVLYRAENRLELSGDSVFRTADGVDITFTSAEIDIESGAFSTNEPVSIRQQRSTINAGSMQVFDNGARVVFENDVRLIIQPDTLPQTSANATDQSP